MATSLLKFSNAAILNATSVALGINAVDGGTCSAVAIGAGAVVPTAESYNIAVGYLATCTRGEGAIVVGATANASPIESSIISLGYATNGTSNGTITLGTGHTVLEYGPHCGFLEISLTYIDWENLDYYVPPDAIAHGYHCIDLWEYISSGWNVIFPASADILSYIKGAVAGTAWWFKLTATRPWDYVYMDTTDATVVLKLVDGYLAWTAGADLYEGRAISMDCLCYYTGSVIEIYCSYA